MSFFRTVSDSESESESEEELLYDSDGQEKPFKSQFLKGGDSDDDDSSEEEDSDEESVKEDGAKKPLRSRFLAGASDSDDDDEEDDKKRTVKSAKDKKLEELDARAKTISNAVNINDWTVVHDEFEKLTRLVTRQTSIVTEPLPATYLKVIVDLEAAIAEAGSAANKKKMNAMNARGLNTMKQKIKKTAKEHETVLTTYKEDPEAYARSLEVEEVPEPTRRTPASTSAAVAVDGGDDFTVVGRGGVVITSDNLFKELQKVLEARGKKNTNRPEQLQRLKELQSAATTIYSKIRVLLAHVSSLFDYNPSTNSFLPLDLWADARKQLDVVFDVLINNPEYVVRDVTTDYDEMIDRAPSANEPVVHIRGNLISLVERLDDEFTKSLQNTDPHSTEYVERLRDEKSLYETIVRALVYYEKLGVKEGKLEEDVIGRLIMRRLEHVYCKPDAVTRALESFIPSALTSTIIPPSTISQGSKAIVMSLCVYLYKANVSLLRTRAMLCHIYHYALSDDYYTARDMMLMSHLQDTVQLADVGTQILYNRAVVQLGLCAFRMGLIKESQATLQEIFGTQRVKELLAQGVPTQKFSVLTPEQEKAEKQRQLPYHMHINIELLECAYLVASMLLEVPHMAQAGDDPESKKKAISRTFRRLLDYSERQVFTGPPENKRDHIMQAARALMKGDWERCRDLVCAIKVWSLMPDEKGVKAMLTQKIKEEGLRTYLYTHASTYSTLSLSHLSVIFSLPLTTVTSLVSKMIWADSFPGSLDQTAGVLVLQQVELTRLQQLALTVADKMNALSESTEKSLESRIGAERERREEGNKEEGGEKGQRRREGKSIRGRRVGGSGFEKGLGRQVVAKS